MTAGFQIGSPTNHPHWVTAARHVALQLGCGNRDKGLGAEHGDGKMFSFFKSPAGSIL